MFAIQYACQFLEKIRKLSFWYFFLRWFLLLWDRCGSFWDRPRSFEDRCGSLWIVVGRCGSFRVLVTTLGKENKGVWLAMPLCSESRKACSNFSIINRLPIGVRLFIWRTLLVCWSWDLTRWKRRSLSASTSSWILCLILARRSISLAFFDIKSAMAKRKTYKRSDEV